MKIAGLATLACSLFFFIGQPPQCVAQQNSSPEAVVNTLRTGTPAIRTALARHLGISQSDVANGLDQCQTQIDHLHLEQATETSILRIKCGYDLYLILFGRTPEEQWRILDSMNLYDAYDKATVEYLSMIRPSTKEIIVRNAATVSGNLYQAYFLVVRVVHGRFRTALTILETATAPRVGSSAREEKSAITVQSATASQVGRIDQVARLTIGSHSFRVHSSYSWSDMFHAFAKDETDLISQIH